MRRWLAVVAGGVSDELRDQARARRSRLLGVRVEHHEFVRDDARRLHSNLHHATDAAPRRHVMKPTLALILLATLAGTAAAQGPAPDNGTGLSTPDPDPPTPQPPIMRFMVCKS